MLAYLEHRPNERHCLNNLRPFWAGLHASDINSEQCKEYAQSRPPVAARRDLEVLRASVNYWHKQVRKLDVMPAFWLPDPPPSRTRHASRSEVARLLLGAMGFTFDPATKKWKRTHKPVRHLIRFIIVKFYTGTRSGAILATKWTWVNFDRAVMARRAPNEPEKKTKRRPPLKAGRRLMFHLRRWHRLDQGISESIIHDNGAPIRKLRRSWGTACDRAHVAFTPHDLRRTRATILMSRARSEEQVEVIAQSLGMSPKVLRDIYTQYDPEWQKEVADVDR